jgi:hypothetical protein
MTGVRNRNNLPVALLEISVATLGIDMRRRSWAVGHNRLQQKLQGVKAVLDDRDQRKSAVARTARSGFGQWPHAEQAAVSQFGAERSPRGYPGVRVGHRVKPNLAAGYSASAVSRRIKLFDRNKLAPV